MHFYFCWDIHFSLLSGFFAVFLLCRYVAYSVNMFSANWGDSSLKKLKNIPVTITVSDWKFWQKKQMVIPIVIFPLFSSDASSIFFSESLPFFCSLNTRYCSISSSFLAFTLSRIKFVVTTGMLYDNALSHLKDDLACSSDDTARCVF